MPSVAQIVLYIIGFAIALVGLYFVDFSKIIRFEKKEFALLVYFLLAIGLGYLVGRFFIEIGTLFKSIVV